MATDFAHSFNLSFMDLQQSEAPVNLLSVDTPYVNTAAEAVVPFRSTTYVAKYVPARPVDKGTIYLQDPSEEEDDHLCVYELSYPQLYTKGYRSYIQKRRRGAEVNFPFPPAPPDFDSNTVRSRESVVQYVRGLATAYNSMIEEPSVFEIYNHAILESVQNYLDAGNSVAQPPLTRSGSAANLTGDSVESSDNSETALSPNRRVSVSFQEGSTLFDETVTESLFYPHMEAEDFSIALFLSNVKTISLKTVQLMFVKLVHSPQLASMVSSDVVEAALTAFSEFLQGSGPSNLKSGLCSLMGIIICSRGRVMELLHFLKILEEYNASSSNIVPLMMPHAKEILQSFSFQSTSHLPVVSPIDCYQEDAVKIKKITLKEGTSVKCFCVSPNTNYLAMSTVNGLVVYDFQKGSLIGQKEYPTEGKSYWNVVFSDDSQHIICTDESGINHTVVTSTLSEIVQETTTSEVSVPLNFVNNELECLPPPYLSYGNSHSLYLFQETDMHLISLKDLNREKIENFTICSHIYKDFCGNLVTLGNDSEALKIDVKKDIVTLSQGDSACYGIVPSTSPWLFLQVKWCKGAWSLYIDFTAVELRGARYGPSKEVSILSASCVKGVGHIGSLAAWAQLSDSSFVRKYYMEKQMAHSPHALFNFPFDEGEGMWAKETVSASCKDLPETLFVWDSKINVPYTNLASKPSVRLKGRHMVEGKVLTSAFRIYIVLPSDHKGADDIVAEADRNTNVIIRVYRCPRSSAENLYSIFYDESELLIYHQRFSTFSRVRLFTKLWKEKELSINGIKESDKPSESIEWFLSELYKRIHLEGTELQRVPEDNSPLLLSSLDLLASLLKEVTTSTSKIKVLALLSLTLIHFNGLLTADESHISRIANTLKIACLHMKDFFTEKMIQDTAAELLNAAMLQSLPLDEKAKILLNLEKPENEHLLKRYISRDTLRPVINYIVTNESDKMKKVAQHVIEVTHKEALSGDGDHTMTGLVFWFVVNAICSLQAVGKLKEITDILEVFVDFASKNLTNDSITGDMRYTVYHAGLIPLLVIVAARCPSVVSPKVEEGLLALSSKIKLDCEQPKVPVSFITREACDVYPPSRNASQLWRFLMNFRNATSVSVLKESTKPLHILYEDKSESGVRTSSMSADWTFLKINNGGKIVFFGDGEITFTTVAQYDFKLNTSWANLLRCTVRHLLLQYCQYLTTQPRNADLPLTPLFRNGLSSVVLEKHDIKTDASSSEINDGVPLPLEILEDTGEGKVYVDRLLQRLRNSVIPSMRPAIQAILAILVHCGCTVEQAEDEVKVRWISGEWGAKLQSANRNSVKELLISLAKWVTTSVRDADLEVETPRSACAPPDKRYDSSFNNSQRSTSDRRSSSAFPQRRSFVKNSFPSDCLEQIRFMVSREVRPEQVEKTMVERVKAAILIEKGLSILGKLLDIDKAMENDDNYKTVMTAVVDVLWRYMVIDSGAHYIDSLSGCGAHLEMKVRVTFHAVLKRCEAYLIGDCPKDIQPQVVLKSTPDNGRTTMKLFAILCHPWDYKDSEFIVGNKSEVDMLKYLEGQLNVPIGNLTLTSPWRLRREDLHSVSEAEEETVKSEYMGAADLGSLSRLFPNDFSFVIPQFQTSRTSDGIVIQKNSSAAGLLRADEGWPLQWKDGLPRVFYFETKITAITGKLEIGLHSTNASNAFVFFYDSTGGTHSTMFPAYGEGDCVGCGLDTTNRKVFFTLNGKFLFFVGAVSEKLDVVFPALHFDDVTGYHVSVNFGTNAFLYDFRQLHPALNLVTGPTWYRVASTAEIVLYYITCCACSIPESKKIGRQFLSDCCEVAGRSVNKVTSSLMNLGVGGDTDPRIRIKQAVIFSVAEYSIMVLISTMRRIVSGTGSLSDSVSDMIFDAASVLMLLPLHSIQISTISLLPAIIPHVHEVRERSTFSNLVRTLFEHAKEEDNTGLIPFVPTWCECDSQYMSIVNVQTARMIPESQRSIVLGNVLPRTGTVSFSVKIRRGTMSKAHSLKGGYFIGISIAGLNPLSPASNSHSWKAVKPPIVWAIHDTSPQLSHATNPTVKSNNFQRTFGNGDVIKVVVNRDTRSVDFYREGEFLKTLFNGIPTDIDLVPFVQLYNDDASATIMPGEMTAPITAPTLLSAASVDVLRSMLTLDPFQDLVSAHLCEELETQQHPKVTLALFNSVADPRVLELRNSTGERQFVTVSRITDNRCKFSIGDEANYEHMYNLRTPAKAKITCLFDAHMSAAALHGLSKCVEKLVAAARRLVVPLITIKALNCQEMAARQQILDDERDHWDFLLHGTRCSNYAQSLKAASANHVPSSVPLVPLDYTYSSDLSHPSVLLSPQYCGRLATVHTQSKNTSTPFIAIAEPSVPLEGKCSIRCQLIRGHNGQILGGGYYFGVCAESFTWKRKELHSTVPEVWAIHDMDDTPWRLRHMHPAANFTITAEPRCIIVSGDTIRLEITRNGKQPGTMHAFRKPINGDEVCLGLIYDNLPPVKLYPFVHLFNTEAVAVLLGSNSDIPAVRLPIQQPHLAICPPKDRRFCDGCTAQHSESRLSSTWFKCNECADYSLCRNCFNMCIHSYHSFTLMGESKSQAHSNYPPARLAPGMEVVVPGTSCAYIKSAGCKRPKKYMNCLIESYSENAVGLWGMVHNGKRAQFTTVVSTLGGEPLTADMPVFIGITTSEEVIFTPREKLREQCFAMAPHLVTYCSDPNVRCKLDNVSRCPYGFQNGSRITFDVDVENKTVTIIRDWIVVGSHALEFNTGSASRSAEASSLEKSQSVFCFISLGKKNIQASILPEIYATVPATVEEVVNPRFVKVKLGDGSSRFLTTESCRMPLYPSSELSSPTFADLLGYTFLGKKMVQVKGTSLAADKRVQIKFLNGDPPKEVPDYALLVDQYESIEEERVLNEDSKNVSATIEEGFVISRLLLIIACLCENEMLTPLVMLNSIKLLDIINGLSSVEISNETPLYFIKEIRDSVAVTADCMHKT
ncbi:hypothetical protein AGDE_12447 [Angomonas deanei]|uniref:SPRY domain containing protein, putative n=1 Tax=Angomonas deanei TaxID=59799 RepID=A0A7G2BZ45_9TRYP|nr:hypothetical protein AGDE_12447 [Angomonas deanei]CAD2212816.1 SPRY domain containing protein, putative [Angomonas deanei]|eukprot:EPY24239.1 hypothetical protein AGDE_12447 [Angomonas deanei]